MTIQRDYKHTNTRAQLHTYTRVTFISWKISFLHTHKIVHILCFRNCSFYGKKMPLRLTDDTSDKPLLPVVPKA